MAKNRLFAFPLSAFFFAVLFSTAWPQQPIPFVPSPMPVVERMLELAEVKKDDLVFDLGSGDGRILIQAAKKYGARGVGIDLDPKLVELAQSKAQEEGVSELVEFYAADALTVDISSATVVTLYMFRWFNNEMRPKLQQLKPGARIVAHDFDIEGWPPTKVEHLPENLAGPDDFGQPRTLYLWKIEGRSSPP
jgi:SAM-dependent methyltransferase